MSNHSFSGASSWCVWLFVVVAVRCVRIHMVIEQRRWRRSGCMEMSNRTPLINKHTQYFIMHFMNRCNADDYATCGSTLISLSLSLAYLDANPVGGKADGNNAHVLRPGHPHHGHLRRLESRPSRWRQVKLSANETNRCARQLRSTHLRLTSNRWVDFCLLTARQGQSAAGWRAALCPTRCWHPSRVRALWAARCPVWDTECYAFPGTLPRYASPSPTRSCPNWTTDTGWHWPACRWTRHRPRGCRPERATGRSGRERFPLRKGWNGEGGIAIKKDIKIIIRRFNCGHKSYN